MDSDWRVECVLTKEELEKIQDEREKQIKVIAELVDKIKQLEADKSVLYTQNNSNSIIVRNLTNLLHNAIETIKQRD